MADMNSILMAIAADTTIASWNPVVTALPDYELKETNTAKCCVTPLGIEYGHSSRGSIQKYYVVEVAFIKRQKNVNVLSLIADLETVAGYFMKQSYAGARVMNVAHDPLYDDERLRTESLFQGVMTLRLQEVTA